MGGSGSWKHYIDDWECSLQRALDGYNTFAHNLPALLAKLGFQMHHIACSLWKYQLGLTKAVTKNALESLSLWQQRVVYWLDRPLLLCTVTLEKPFFLIYSSGERATDSFGRVAGSEKGNKKGEGSWTGLQKGTELSHSLILARPSSKRCDPSECSET